MAAIYRGRLLDLDEPMRRLKEKLGFVPSPERSTVVMRGPLM